jgi:hypothetical protein
MMSYIFYNMSLSKFSTSLRNKPDFMKTVDNYVGNVYKGQ